MHVANMKNISILVFGTIFYLGNISIDNVGAAKMSGITNVEKNKVIEGLLRDYDGNLRPSGANGTRATIVSTNFYVRSIRAIDDKAMLWKTQLTFRLQWYDPGLKFSSDEGIPYVSIPHSMVDQIWKPDVFFSNELEYNLHTGMQKNQYFRVFPNGDVLYSSRISLTLSCPMILKKYPYDKQTCSIRIASYGYTTDDIIFKWKATDPVQVTSDLHLPNFSLESFTTDYCDSQTNTGVYSCLRLDLLLARESSYFFPFYFSMMGSIFLACLTFWLHPVMSAIPRSLILVMCFFYYQFVTFEILKMKASVSYSTLLDCWISWCSFFIYLAILEFVTISYLGQGSNNIQGVNEIEQVNQNGQKIRNLKQSIQGMSLSTKIDVLFRIIYPIAFIIFMIVYFFCFAKEDYYDY